jgi:hypothetical protein
MICATASPFRSTTMPRRPARSWNDLAELENVQSSSPGFIAAFRASHLSLSKPKGLPAWGNRRTRSSCTPGWVASACSTLIFSTSSSVGNVAIQRFYSQDTAAEAPRATTKHPPQQQLSTTPARHLGRQHRRRGLELLTARFQNRAGRTVGGEGLGPARSPNQTPAGPFFFPQDLHRTRRAAAPRLVRLCGRSIGMRECAPITLRHW